MKIRQYNYEENIKKNITADTLIYDLFNNGIISARTFNVCQNYKITTVSDIQKFGHKIEDFITLRNCGKKTAIELFELLQSLKLTKKHEGKNEFYERCSVQIRAILNNWHDLMQIKITDYKFLIFFKKITLNAEKTFENLLLNPYFFIKNELYNSIESEELKYKYRQNLIKHFEELRNNLNSSGISDTNLKVIISNINEIQEVVRKEFIIQHFKYDMPVEKQTHLILKLEELISDAPTRAKTLHYSYIKNIEGIIPYFSFEFEQFITSFGNKKKGAVEYYQKILQPFKEIYNITVSEKKDYIYYNIKYKFPFLNELEITFVKDFYSNHKHYPMFYIAKSMLINSKQRNLDLLCRKLGIGDYSTPQTLEEIASAYSLTRERVRQILSKPFLQTNKLFFSEDWMPYFKLGNIIITEISDYYKNICQSEELIITFETFAIIYCSVFKYEYINSDIEYVVDIKYTRQLSSILNSLIKLKKQNFSNDVCYSLKDIFSEDLLKDDYLCHLVLTEICSLLEIEVRENKLFFEQNHIDVATEIYNFLYSCGEPKHIYEIKDFLSDKYPYKNFSLVNLKFKIRENPYILPVGNTSKYKLKHWRNVYGGSIRDLIRDILSASDKPLHLDFIANKVTDVYENTNRRNVQSSMSSSEDFESYAGGLWGLKNKIYSNEYQRIDLSKKRNSFRERFDDYKNFVYQFYRLPYQSGIEEEDSLKRWQTNVIKGLIDTTPEQVKLLKDFIYENSHLPQNGREVKFRKTCKEYFEYVETHYELPTPPSTLYCWFTKHIKIYLTYEDNRKVFFDDLLSNLKGYGFYF